MRYRVIFFKTTSSSWGSKNHNVEVIQKTVEMLLASISQQQLSKLLVLQKEIHVPYVR